MDEAWFEVFRQRHRSVFQTYGRVYVRKLVFGTCLTLWAGREDLNLRSLGPELGSLASPASRNSPGAKSSPASSRESGSENGLMRRFADVLVRHLDDPISTSRHRERSHGNLIPSLAPRRMRD